MSPTATASEMCVSYKTRADFASPDEYAAYVRDNVRVCAMVRCYDTYEEVQEGDIGTVITVTHNNFIAGKEREYLGWGWGMYARLHVNKSLSIKFFS